MSFHPFSAVKARNALRDGTLSPSSERKYWFFSSMVWLFYIYHAGWTGLERTWFLAYDVLVATAILWIGLNESFKANGGDDGQDLLQRLFVLSVPLGVGVLVASQALYWLSWHVFPVVFDHSSFRDPRFAWQILNFALFNGIQAWFWWRMVHHLRILYLQRLA